MSDDVYVVVSWSEDMAEDLADVLGGNFFGRAMLVGVGASLDAAKRVAQSRWNYGQAPPLRWSDYGDGLHWSTRPRFKTDQGEWRDAPRVYVIERLPLDTT